MAIYKGIDVSNWQGRINFSEVKNSDYFLLIIKLHKNKRLLHLIL